MDRTFTAVTAWQAFTCSLPPKSENRAAAAEADDLALTVDQGAVEFHPTRFHDKNVCPAVALKEEMLMYRREKAMSSLMNLTARLSREPKFAHVPKRCDRFTDATIEQPEKNLSGRQATRTRSGQCCRTSRSSAKRTTIGARRAQRLDGWQRQNRAQDFWSQARRLHESKLSNRHRAFDELDRRQLTTLVTPSTRKAPPGRGSKTSSANRRLAA